MQAIPEIAEEAAQVYVLQRTANYDIAGGNRPMNDEDGRKIKANYRQIWKTTRETGFGFPYHTANRTALSVSDEERQQIFAEAWERGGFRLGTTFNDLLLDAEANETAAEFLRARIRGAGERPGDRRVALAAGPPVLHQAAAAGERLLRDVQPGQRDAGGPAEGVDPGDHTHRGADRATRSTRWTSIVYATGFDAMTGTLFKLGIRGRNGLGLQEKWADGPRSYLGVATHGFPNLFMITGPQSPSVLSNMPVSIEQHVDWITDCLRYLREKGLRHDRADPRGRGRLGRPPQRGHRR